MHKIRRETTNKIKQEIAKVAKSVFHIVSENVEEKHVSDDVENVGVEEHGSEKSVQIFRLKYVGWNHEERLYKLTHCCVFGKECIIQERNENYYVYQYENSRYVRGCLGTILVSNRNEHSFTKLQNTDKFRRFNAINR